MISISLTGRICTGEVLQQEHLKAAEAQNLGWLQKRPPGSSYKPAGNASLPQLKGHMGGNTHRNQDLLKDEPEKYSLRTPGVTLKVGWVEKSDSCAITRKGPERLGPRRGSADSKQMSAAV